MSQPLRSSLHLIPLAQGLGVPARVNPVDGILSFCEDRVSQLMSDFPDCDTPGEMLDCVAAKIKIVFEEIHSDEDLERVIKKYVALGEMAFVALVEELSGETYGVTIRRRRCDEWECPYVAVIDLRGDKSARAYFTKWHEIAHALTLTDETRDSFRRTHSSVNQEDPEERMMDVIAAKLGFNPAMTGKFMRAHGDISFEAVEELRETLCPGASRQASLINLARFWPQPCVLINAALGLKKQQEAAARQQGFSFHDAPQEKLRALCVTRSDAAREMKLNVHLNWRVPKQSVIHRAFFDSVASAEAVENLDWWQASNGNRLDSQTVRVQARRGRDSVDALIVPICS